MRRMAMMACLLRDPEKWRALMRVEFDPDAGTFGELLNDLTRQTGLKVRFELPKDALQTRITVNFPISVMELSGYVLSSLPAALLMEKDEICITSTQQARAYLAEWLKEWK
jgi:hypothetical protein